MAVRVTEAEVKIIIETTQTPLTDFIADANLHVNNVLLAQGLDEATLKMIEKYYCAHLICVRDARMAIEEVEGAGTSFEGSPMVRTEYKSPLKTTRYGLRVLEMDTTGRMASMGGPPAKIELLGSPLP